MPESFNKVVDLTPATLKKETQEQLFFCEFCEISKNTFFTERLWMTSSGEGYPCDETPQFEGMNSKIVVIFPL